MTIETNYTAQANVDTLKSGALQSYRLMHWLAHILRNFMADPITVKDERIARILKLQDGDTAETLRALFDIGTPYSQETKKACTTTMIIIGLGDTSYPAKPVNNIAAPCIARNRAVPAQTIFKLKIIDCYVSVDTESYDGTVLLAGLIEDFLCQYSDIFPMENPMISQFTVLGVKAPTEVALGTGSNAKPIYQSIIQIRMMGGLSWYLDTQGPVFRGITTVPIQQ